jgi:hypothetical protein
MMMSGVKVLLVIELALILKNKEPEQHFNAK